MRGSPNEGALFNILEQPRGVGTWCLVRWVERPAELGVGRGARTM